MSILAFKIYNVCSKFETIPVFCGSEIENPELLFTKVVKSVKNIGVIFSVEAKLFRHHYVGLPSALNK